MTVAKVWNGSAWEAIAGGVGAAQLAAIDARVSALERRSIVTSLPSSPADGDEVYFVASATDGIIWHLRYRAAAPAPYRWEFLGGSPLVSRETGQSANTSQPTGASGFVDLTGGVLGKNAPLEGDYRIQCGAIGNVRVGAGYAVMSPAPNPTIDDGLWYIGGSYESRSGGMTRLAVLAGAPIKIQHGGSSDTAGNWLQRWIEILPIRVKAS